MSDEETTDQFSSLEYISEDDLNTFDGWLRYHAIDLASLSEEQAIEVRARFDEAPARRNAAPRMVTCRVSSDQSLLENGADRTG